jgi:hypothetical protein
MGEWRYSSTILHLCTRWRQWPASRPYRFTPQGKDPLVPIGQESGWALEPVWKLWRRENPCTEGNQTRTVQPVARRYTDWALTIPITSHIPLVICISLVHMIGVGPEVGNSRNDTVKTRRWSMLFSSRWAGIVRMCTLRNRLILHAVT